MNNLVNLDIDQKRVLLKVFVALFVVLNISIFISIYRCFGVETGVSHATEYEVRMKEYLKAYGGTEARYEQFSFYENYNDLVLENRELNKGYREGVNTFSNMSQDTFYSFYSIIKEIADERKFGEISRLEIQYYDWSNKQAVIRDERGFDTSHIFAVLTAIEYQISNSNDGGEGVGAWVTLSAQEIIDCCPSCLASSTPEAVYQYIMEHGVTTEGLYPYLNYFMDKVPRTCRREEFKATRYWIDKFVKVRGCGGLQLYLSKGPLVVGVDSKSFTNYLYGIFQ